MFIIFLPFELVDCPCCRPICFISRVKPIASLGRHFPWGSLCLSALYHLRPPHVATPVKSLTNGPLLVGSRGHDTQTGGTQADGRTDGQPGSGSPAGSRFHVRNVLGMTLISDFPRAVGEGVPIPLEPAQNFSRLSTSPKGGTGDGGWNRQKEGQCAAATDTDNNACPACLPACLPFISPERLLGERTRPRGMFNMPLCRSLPLPRRRII